MMTGQMIPPEPEYLNEPTLEERWGADIADPFYWSGRVAEELIELEAFKGTADQRQIRRMQYKRGMALSDLARLVGKLREDRSLSKECALNTLMRVIMQGIHSSDPTVECLAMTNFEVDGALNATELWIDCGGESDQDLIVERPKKKTKTSGGRTSGRKNKNSIPLEGEDLSGIDVREKDEHGEYL